MASPILTDEDIAKFDAQNKPKILTDADIASFDVEQSRQKTKIKPSIYSEVVAPILEGGSTFAAGVPRMVAKAQGAGMEEATFPEQQTIPGKLLRGVSETVGFTAGAPGRVAKILANVAGKGLSKIAGKEVLKNVVKGVVGGAAGGFTAGSDLKERKDYATLGGVAGGVLPAIVPGARGVSRFFNKAGAKITGIENDVLKEVEQKGFRKVINEKYLSKKLPEEIQNRIGQNMDNLESAAGQKYNDLTTPLRKIPFDVAELRGRVVKVANRIKTNPFETDVSKLDNEILNGIVNKAKINNLGDALDLRRSLDDVIYNNSGELKSTFGKEVRNLLNQELHKNKGLKQVDADWASLQGAIRDGRKVIGETGENFLKRFSSLTAKQKQMLVSLEKQIGGEPFIEDITNWSLAQKFANRQAPLSSVSSLIQSVTKPVYRSGLRQGEKVIEGLSKGEDWVKDLVNQIQR